MFGFGKKSRDALAREIMSRSVKAAEEFLDYLKEDSYLYGKCINQVPIKNTAVLFMVNLYGEILRGKYEDKEVYIVMRFIILSLGKTKKDQELFWSTFMSYLKTCDEAQTYYEQFPDYDPSAVLTKVFFSLVIEDRQYLENELERSIPASVSYRKIYHHIDGVLRYQTILDEEYAMKRK